MTRTYIALWAAGATLALAASSLHAQTGATTAITYQGKLTSGGLPANGTYDLIFRLFTAATAGSQNGPTICQDNVQVTDGLLTTTLDFGPAFDGNARWLQVGVRPDTTAGNCVTGTFTTLAPRQPLTAAPYASGLSLPASEHTSNTGPALWITNDDGPAIRAENSNGWAGYFAGACYFTDKVGLGTTNPLEVPLQIVGGADATLTSGGNIVIGETTGHNVVIDNNEIMSRNNAAAANLYLNALGGQVGIGTNAPTALLSVNGAANKPGGGSWSTFSDARLKKNVQPLTGALDTLLQLRGVTFEYTDPGAIHELPGTRTGMIAQQVEQVIPDWVDDGPDGYKRITYRGFEALTVEAFRDQQGQLESLREENARLRRRLDELAEDIRAMRSTIERPTHAHAP